MKVKIAKTSQEIEFCKEAVLAFRPNVDEENFVSQVSQMMEDGFTLAYISDDLETKAVAITGYRIINMLRTGPIIYIDDLYTSPECRGKGYAKRLLDFVDDEGKKMGINAVHLDSGYMLHDAHRLYLNQGYHLACNHFAKMIG
ncbi:Acetyltransferase (GNAT) family protein [Dyadobacter koreensis]|uniref:Acetyltransferase (GNAT) family protein n=1 Tax=Dyadobacter koreensis TaxID=408657 RepID=A0A1H6YS07_9BACT|nr:GNAT family N-acetyltransferase [Dyadobacter koreensis]SEJ40042.1 Acetyltransferase (GNAT) family protein [Dyadobacter koreensis]